MTTPPAATRQTLPAEIGIVFGRYARQTLRSRISMIFGLLQPVLFLVLFGPLLRDVPLGGAGDSWQTLVPGLLVQLGLFSASFAGIGIIMEKQLGVVERMRVTPVRRSALLFGRVLRDMVQLIIQSLLIVLLGSAMGLRVDIGGVLIGFLLVALLGISLASLSNAFAMRVSTPQEFAPVINSVSMPAMLLSGILLPMTLAPGWLDAISHFVPFRYIVDAVRAAYVGHYGDAAVLQGTLAAVALAAVALTLGVRLFSTART